MNPQTVYAEINKEAWTHMWDTMTDYARKVVANDREHRTSMFAEWQQRISDTTDVRFNEWAATASEPMSSNDFLWGNELAPENP